MNIIICQHYSWRERCQLDDLILCIFRMQQKLEAGHPLRVEPEVSPEDVKSRSSMS